MANIAGIIARRLLIGTGVLVLVVTFIFVAMRLAADPAVVVLGADATTESIAAFRAEHGLDRPLHVQWASYMLNSATGDFGVSYRYHAPALAVVLERLPATLTLGGLATLFAILIGVPVGMYSAVRSGSITDNVSRVVAVMGQSMPIFWTAILLIVWFSIGLEWFPSVGTGSWRHLVLPTMALTAYSVPLIMRLSRSSMLEVLNQDYIRTARSKGVSRFRVFVHHALRNAILPVITVIGVRISHVVSGTVVLEEVFAYPGLGRLGIDSLRTLDFPVVQAFVLVLAAIIILINLLIDIAYELADPRLRLG